MIVDRDGSMPAPLLQVAVDPLSYRQWVNAGAKAGADSAGCGIGKRPRRLYAIAG